MSSSDTGLPSEVVEVDVTVPELFADLKAEAENLEEEVDQLKDIQDDIEDIDPADIEEVDQVADQVETLRGDLIEAETVEDIESVYDAVIQAIASPYIEQAKTSYVDICDCLEVSVESDTDEEIVSSYESADGDDIEAIATTLSEVADTIDEFREETQSSIVSDIEDRETRYFKLPRDELQPLVADYKSREESLKKIGSKAAEAGDWAAPLVDLPEHASAYSSLDASIDPDQVTEYIDQIEFSSRTDEIPVIDVVTAQLRDTVNDGDVTELTDTLNSILQSDLNDDHVGSVAELLNHTRTDTQGRETELQDAYNKATSSGEHETISGLNDALSRLEDSFQDWATTIQSHIQAAARIQREISSEDSDHGEFESDSEHVQLEEDVERATIMAHPVDALEVVGAFDEWLSGISSDEDGDGVPVEIVTTLVQGEPISARDVSAEEVEQLTELVGEGLLLTYRRPENE